MRKERYKEIGADADDRRPWLSSLSAVLIQSLGWMWLRWMGRWAAATKARWRELWGLPNRRPAMEWVAFKDANCRGAGVADRRTAASPPRWMSGACGRAAPLIGPARKVDGRA